MVETREDIKRKPWGECKHKGLERENTKQNKIVWTF
jgi:hypothetical protein